MRQSLASLLTFGAILGILPATTGAQTIAIYDNFDGTKIDHVKWRGSEFASSFAINSTDAARTIVRNQLRLLLRTHSASDAGIGLAGEAFNRLVMSHPALVDRRPEIRVMQSNVTVTRAVAEDCAASDVGTAVQAGLLGIFFNSGGANLPAFDLTGDVLAVLDMRQHSRLGRTINAAVLRCANDRCNIAETIRSDVFATSWTPGTAVGLTIHWQPGQDRFLFRAGSETKALGYPPPTTRGRAKTFLKDLHVNNALPRCATPVQAAIDARFDSLAIDAKAVDAME